MAKDLVNNPETKLGGAEKPYMDLGGHLEYIESLLEQGAGGAGGNDAYLVVNATLDNFVLTEEEMQELASGKYVGIKFKLENVGGLALYNFEMYIVYHDEESNTYNFGFRFFNYNDEGINHKYITGIDILYDSSKATPATVTNTSYYCLDESADNILYKPTTRPTSQLIPSITTSNTQQNLTIGNGLAIENGVLKTTSGGGGSSKVWYELPSLFFLENITQEQFDAIKNLVLQNQLAGINCAGIYCPLTFYNDGRDINFFYPWYENDIFTAYIVRLNADLSVKKIPYSTITLPQTTPTSQLIPSITTSNEQQNLTIGNGLEIENGVLKTTGSGGGKSVPPTLNLFDFNGGKVRTTITEEEKTNLENGLYNQVIFPVSILDSDVFQVFMPSKLIGDKSFDVNSFVQFDYVMSGDTITINALSLYRYSFGAKDTSGNYPITIEKQMDMLIGGSSGGGNIWYDLTSLNGNSITQEQYNEIKSLIDSNSLAGIKTVLQFFPLVSENNGEFKFAIFSKDYEQIDSNKKLEINDIYFTIKPDLSITNTWDTTPVVELTKNLSSQSIPSIKTDGYQENLTIGNGLEIKDGALKTTTPPLPSDASSKTYTLQTVNGVLTWTDAIGDINTILDNINGEVI